MLTSHLTYFAFAAEEGGDSDSGGDKGGGSDDKGSSSKDDSGSTKMIQEMINKNLNQIQMIQPKEDKQESNSEDNSNDNEEIVEY